MCHGSGHVMSLRDQLAMRSLTARRSLARLGRTVFSPCRAWRAPFSVANTVARSVSGSRPS